jgi:phenylalanyl-tRNA synthetase beta chain
VPTLEGHFDDLLELLGKTLLPEEMGRTLDAVKGEWKQFDPATRRFKIELNDTNRPDLWSVEGIARQLRGGRPLPGRPYDFLEKAGIRREKDGDPDIRIDPSTASVRPFLGGFTARGGRLGEEGLVQLIGTQERLSELFGRKRADVAIGVYPLGRIAFPLSYRTADPALTRFVPLGGEREMTLREIVESHPKGQAYGSLVSSHAAWPVLSDSRGTILSFPPVINARSSGEVTGEDDSLFVEATGFDPGRLLLVLNILAANLTDRGYVVEPLMTGGRPPLVAPASPGILVHVPSGLPARILGAPNDPADFVETLLEFGYSQIAQKDKNGEEGWEVLSPFTRDDLLGAVDVVEDYLVAKGYDSFAPVLPREFTRGRPAPRQKIETRLRQALLAMGYQELLSNILTGEPLVSERLGRSGEDLVRIDNPASLQYAVVRPTLLSGLLSAEARSSRASYPHRLFEVGEAMALGEGLAPTGRPVRDLWLLSALLSHPQASVSELQGVLEMVFERMDRTLSIRSADRPPFLPGRCGIYVNAGGKGVATVGEIHPETLDRWGIRMPTVCFEVDLEVLLAS